MRDLVAVAVAGKQNVTLITGALPLSDQTMESFARVVAGKRPGRTYYVVAVRDTSRGTKKAGVLFRWHVGEGFTHPEGWWVESGD